MHASKVPICEANATYIYCYLINVSQYVLQLFAQPWNCPDHSQIEFKYSLDQMLLVKKVTTGWSKCQGA